LRTLPAYAARVNPRSNEIYGFDTGEILESLLVSVHIHSGTEARFLGLDVNDNVVALVREFAEELCGKLNFEPSVLYKLATDLMPYKIVPERIRCMFMRSRAERHELSFTGSMHLERIRKRFLEILNLTEFKIRRPMCFLTHDVDSKVGLRRALRFKEIEERYEIESTWFLLTDEYELDRGIVKRLAENGEVASHGTRHDGRLLCCRVDSLVAQLRRGKHRLEEITEREVCGFRAPLLQYNGRVVKAIGEAGFKWDSSMPTWEPVHPSTMKADGIGLINPIKLHRVWEIPVTLPQDYQMLRILTLTPEQTIREWIRLMNEIRELGGISVFLIHPDYEFASDANLRRYEKLLISVKADGDFRVMSDLTSAS